jgi:hypothetical protein
MKMPIKVAGPLEFPVLSPELPVVSGSLGQRSRGWQEPDGVRMRARWTIRSRTAADSQDAYS